jgi:hypothetical protein
VEGAGENDQVGWSQVIQSFTCHENALADKK